MDCEIEKSKTLSGDTMILWNLSLIFVFIILLLVCVCINCL